MSAIKNRYEFMLFLACVNANPNGDPDMANMPRVDADTMKGYITDAAIKRRVRDYVAMAHGDEDGMDIMVQQSCNLNRKIAQAKSLAGVALNDKGKPAIDKSRLKACETFFDVRTFGAVMASGPNAGQVRGPVQVSFGQSLDPVRPMDIAITRVACAEEVKSATTVDEYLEKEAQTPDDKLRTMGRKQFIPFGLYEIHGFISANLAEQPGFDEKDLDYFFEALANMYDATRSSSKGSMSVVSPVIIFKHVGDPSRPVEEQANQAKLGRAPAYKLFELVRCEKKAGCTVPGSYRDYECEVDLSGRPDGIEVGFLPSYCDKGVTWNRLPDGETWMTSK